MNCPKCDSRNVYTVKAYDAGSQGKFSDMRCENCGTKITCTTFVVAVNPKYGDGAHARAKKAKSKK